LKKKNEEYRQKLDQCRVEMQNVELDALETSLDLHAQLGDAEHRLQQQSIYVNTMIASHAEEKQALNEQLVVSQQLAVELQQHIDVLIHPVDGGVVQQLVGGVHPATLASANAPDDYMTNEELESEFNRLKALPAAQAELEMWRMPNAFIKRTGDAAIKNATEGLYMMKAFSLIFGVRPTLAQWEEMSRVCGRACARCVANNNNGKLRMGSKYCSKCEEKSDVGHTML
jgi:hypothetical protein